MSKTWNNELKFGRWTYFGWCPPPIQNCQRKEQALCVSIPSMRAHLKQSIDKKMTGDVLPPCKTAREKSKLFAYIYCQWEPIQNGQLIRKYKEILVHIENIEIPKSDLLGKTYDRPPQSNIPHQRMNFFLFSFTQVKLTIDPPPIKLKKKLYMVYSFTFYPALLSSLIILSFGVEQLDRSVMHLFL